MSETTTHVPVMEVFASIQGEGAYVGEPQVFVRLRGCPMRCEWCDTPGSWDFDGESARIAEVQGNAREDAWATPFQVATWIARVEPREARTVSVTGGEPLVWPEFLVALRGMIGERRMHLETAGGHPRSLEAVIDVVDHVSLDLKLPQDLAPPLEPVPLADRAAPTREEAPRGADEWRAARRRCLELVAERDACAKLIVAGNRTLVDFEPLLEDLANLAPDVPLVLQPVTPANGVTAPGADFMTDLVEEARDLGLNVRVVPQVHRALGLP